MFARIMECEICGAKIRGAPKVIYIEGAEMRVCLSCAKRGTEVEQPGRRAPRSAAPGSATPGSATSRQAAAMPKRRRRDVFDLMEGEIVDDYADRIREARVARGWSQKELAAQIKEREILVKKIEKGDLIPEDDVRKKIEQELGIALLERSEFGESSDAGGQVTTTFGDLIKIKRGK